jgi:predicted transcriptional regulator
MLSIPLIKPLFFIFEELLTIRRNLYPENRHLVLTIALETQRGLSETAKSAEPECPPKESG